MSLHSLPLFVRLAGKPVILLGSGAAAEAKRRLLDRAGAIVVEDHADARLAIVAIENEDDARAAVDRLRARGVLVNAVDRPDWCDITMPAIVERDPVLIAIGTGGASAGLAGALRQRLEAMLPTALGGLARALFAAREALRTRYPDDGARRRALGAALAEGGALDPMAADGNAVPRWLDADAAILARRETIRLRSADPDDLTLREVRWLGQADRVYHHARVPAAILDRARADAARICGPAPAAPQPGLTVVLEMDLPETLP
ncbi:uroporphyrin-III C-methyltransferase/precorrin-2 dehydrogenase/sirohydrochlorin ferrochelatase [Hephaestia caeni]|uniref:precorrin-2 dehydrogenase n=1 Tax=Hephaestia caeni TaxID=645617 RepID=A0A397P5S5_9SPHN|nr:NAD(P)-dependent oxidoreductase [Hephaestia caeni]RIA44532.1 uroporphyrin-III C-methyltransferase/precorrin-2 dehydrogenase/sirohydrochlorin ferrochelatase [Hephaestia caeni]